MGELISRGHECDPPTDLTGLQTGALYRCDCQRIWVLVRSRNLVGSELRTHRWDRLDPLLVILRGLAKAALTGNESGAGRSNPSGEGAAGRA